MRARIPGVELWLPKRIEEIAIQFSFRELLQSAVPLWTIELQIVVFTAIAFWRFKWEEI